MFFRFAYYQSLYITIPLAMVTLWYQWYYKKPVRYQFALTSEFKRTIPKTILSYRTLFFLLRAIPLLLLPFLIARPQMVDANSKVHIEGIDIMMALDVSGSMQLLDNLHDKRMRIDIAKSEAIRFIEKRTNDSIGLVLFGGMTLARCPLTLDKPILKEIIASIRLGELPADGTQLATGLATAVNKLRHSKAKSKIVILLTDGIPNGDELSIESAINVAKKMGIKVYAVGIGNEQGSFAATGIGYLPQDDSIDMKLLEKIAHETGGKAFRANNADEVTRIYDTIDALEKSEIESTLFQNYHEYFMAGTALSFFCIALEMALRLFVFRGIA